MTVTLYHLCASMRAHVRACACFKPVEGLPRYFCCGCAAETIALLSYKSPARKAHYSYFTLGTVARSVAIYLSLLSRSFSDHHLRCGGWLNLEFSKREKHSGSAIKTIYKK